MLCYTAYGNFELNKMPFILTYASSSLQYFINHVLRDTEACCFSFIDNIFIFSPDLSIHKHHLLDIANRLNEYGLTLNMQKSVPRKAELEILGDYFYANGIKPLNKNSCCCSNVSKTYYYKAIASISRHDHINDVLYKMLPNF